jgi:co-chaperonin GroES (HSP10)
MTKRVSTALLLLVAIVFAAGVFAAPPTTGKVVSVGDGSVQISIEGDRPAWVKKGAPVKFKEGVGKVLEVSAEGVSPVVITVKTRKAAEMKAGEAVSFEKGKAMSGC